MGAFEDGTSFLTGVLAKLPEGQRAQVKAAFEAPEAKEAVVLLGDSVLARSDYSKRMDDITKRDGELKAKLQETTDLYTRNDAWYKTNEAALKEAKALREENDRLKADGGGDDDRNRPPVLDKKTIEQTIDEMMSTREQGYVEVVSYMTDLSSSHQRLFGEPLNTRELLANPKLGKPILGQPGRVFSLQDAYQERFGEQIKTKQKEDHDKGIETEVQKRLQEERIKLHQQPYPLRGQIGPSVLDVLDTKEGSASHTLDTAVALYDTLQANRG